MKMQKWLQELASADPARQREVAGFLLKSFPEHYFDEKKISREDRQMILETLVPLAAHEDAQVRRCVANMIGMLRIWSERVGRILDALLRDKEPVVQATAVWASGYLGEAASPLVEPLLRLAEHKDREVRFRVPWTLGKIRRHDEAVRDALLRLTRDRDDTARLFAFEAIAACMPEADGDIVAAVRSGLSDRDLPSRVGACRVVCKVPGDWSAVKQDLDAVFATGLVGEKAEAVFAICHCWPERVASKDINRWLRENQGYWWVTDLLAGKALRP